MLDTQTVIVRRHPRERALEGVEHERVGAIADRVSMVCDGSRSGRRAPYWMRRRAASATAATRLATRYHTITSVMTISAVPSVFGLAQP